tara:strand:+ start:359 stop:658 length:300 start_codon:yes stop_codon:yes gene_type:complete
VRTNPLAKLERVFVSINTVISHVDKRTLVKPEATLPTTIESEDVVGIEKVISKVAVSIGLQHANYWGLLHGRYEVSVPISVSVLSGSADEVGLADVVAR